MRYEAPTTTKAAAKLLAAEKGAAYLLAGGTDLMVRLKGGFIEPDLVVDIKRIPATQDFLGGWYAFDVHHQIGFNKTAF